MISNNNSTRTTKGSFATLLVVSSAAVCQAVWTPLAMADPVRVAGQQAFDVGGTGRAAAVQKNIDNALVASKNHTEGSVGVVYVKGQPVLTLGGFYVTTVDAAAAKTAHTTPALLAQKWASGLKSTMKSSAAVDQYVNQLTGSSNVTASAGTTTTTAGSYPYYKQGRIVYIPAGMTIPVALKTALSSGTAKAGDPIEGQIAETVNLGDAMIPAGSIITGKVTEATAGQRAHAGLLGMKFDTLRTPDGQTVPITAHIEGSVGNYQELGTSSNTLQGESTHDKVKQALIRGAIGAGGGAVLGTAIGAIASHGYNTGSGTMTGTVLGGALGVADALLLRKGNDVTVGSGQTFKLLLDAPASLAATM
jgi:hypothetical protein